MKQKKQRNLWMGLLLTVMLVVSMVMPAMATEGSTPTGSITITGAVDGQVYKAYKIFNLESYDVTNNRYSYRVVEAWKDFDWKTYGITVDTDGYVTNVASITDAQSAALAKAALTHAGTTIGETATVTAANNSAVFSGLGLGYYLVDSSLGALCGLNTTATSVNIAEKNSKPTIVKGVRETEVESFGPSTNADMGQQVEFQLVVNVGTGYKVVNTETQLGTGIDNDFVITDTFPAGMSYVTDSISVKSGNTTWVKDTEFTLASDGDVYTITLKKEKLDDLSANTEVIVTYKATVDDDAEIGTKGNTNTAVLTYNGYTTASTSAVVRTHEISVFKFYTSSPNTKTPLANAVFQLKDANGNVLNIEETGTDNVYRYDATSTTTNITTDTTGKFKIHGLDVGTYKLSEVTAPDGYNKLTEDIIVTIEEVEAADGTVTVAVNYKMKATDEKFVAADANDGILVENKTGSILPSTGGMGTTIFYIVGAGLVLVAGVLLITRKRMSAEEK